jgi:AbrB family looped-hinge helix DNA binding protein
VWKKCHKWVTIIYIGGESVGMNRYLSTLVLDKHGRIVIPVRVRNEMGLNEGDALVLKYDGYQITIEKGEKKHENEN